MASDDEQYDYEGDSGEDCYYSGGEDVDPDIDEPFYGGEEDVDADIGEPFYGGKEEDVDPDIDEPSYGGEENDCNEGYGFGYGYASEDRSLNHYEETGDEADYGYGYNGQDKSTMTTNQNTGPTTNTYELTRKSSNYDNQTGSYIRGTVKDSYSSGDYSNRGRSGYKDEYKSSSTLRVGDKRGYTEYFKQEKETRVEYNNPNTNYSGSGKTYNNYNGSGWAKRYHR